VLIGLAHFIFCLCMHDNAFSALTLLAGWQEGHPACKKTEWWGSGVVICLERGADLHMAHRHSLTDKGPLNVYVCVCVHLCMYECMNCVCIIM